MMEASEPFTEPSYHVVPSDPLKNVSKAPVGKTQSWVFNNPLLCAKKLFLVLHYF